MTMKSEAKGTVIDWERVEKVTEIKRTYLVKDPSGHREFFKMWTPSEAKHMLKAMGWTGSIVSTIDRNINRRKRG